MAEAAAAAEAAGADLVDINMGCPVPKVCKTGAGAALLDDLDRAAAIVRAMADAVSIPVTVKMRRGLRAERRRPGRGRAALRGRRGGGALRPSAGRDRALRGRGRPRGHRAWSPPRWTSRSWPAATSPRRERARRVIEDSGCAAVAVGRAALGDPWAFARIATGVDSPPPSLAEVVDEIERFAADARAALGEGRADHFLRKFYPWYLAGRDVPPGELEALVTAPDAGAALQRLRALAAAPAAA